MVWPPTSEATYIYRLHCSTSVERRGKGEGEDRHREGIGRDFATGRGEVLAEGPPVRGDPHMLVAQPVLGHHRIGERRRRAALAGHLGRDALEDLGRQMGLDEN